MKRSILFVALVALVALVGCSHIPIEDARWIAENAKNISQVEERLGSPERADYGRSYVTAHYEDFGRHVTFSGGIALPGVGLLILLIEDAFFPHQRFLHVTYEPSTGAIVEIDPRSPDDVRHARYR